VSPDCGPLQFVEPNLLVLGEKYPAVPANERQPNGVFRARSEVISVALVLDAVLRERVEDGPAVMKIFVKI